MRHAEAAAGRARGVFQARRMRVCRCNPPGGMAMRDNRLAPTLPPVRCGLPARPTARKRPSPAKKLNTDHDVARCPMPPRTAPPVAPGAGRHAKSYAAEGRAAAAGSRRARGSGGARPSKADHFLFEALGERRISDAHNAAYRPKAGRLMPAALVHGLQHDTANLEHVAEVCEMAAVRQWGQAGDGDGGGRGGDSDGGEARLEDLCRWCFGFLEACPVPEKPAAKFSHVLRLFAYAYMGDRWEAMRRYAAEHGDGLALQHDGEACKRAAERWGWEFEVMSGVYDAFLLLVKKGSAGDLRRCGEIVEGLRRRQEGAERPYLESLERGPREAASCRLAAMYHLARAVEVLAEFMRTGAPGNIETMLELHFDKAIEASGIGGSAELDVLLRVARPAFRKMARNSVWMLARSAGGGLAEFVASIAGSRRPTFELLYPQREAILSGGLLDQASNGIVVNLPTSAGKTLLAEFKIVQSAGRGGVVAYTAPTRALVNQIAARLRRDLGPVGLRVEKMVGAVEIDGFEDGMLTGGSFNVLVTTPEKLLLLVRNPKYGLARSMSLCIVDEAHNLGDEDRGMNLEMMISTVKRECAGAGLLLLTPFIPNSDEVARWIDPQRPQNVGVGINWRPNDLMVGAYYAEGRGRKTTTYFKPLATSAGTVTIDGPIRVGRSGRFPRTAGEAKKASCVLTSLLATQIDRSHGLLVLSDTIDRAWKMADLIYENIDGSGGAGPLAALAKKFVASELGEEFPLARYLDRGIGVHHGGPPDEVRALMERLMESGQMQVLVGTTTVAQGLNFPVSGILVSSYAQGRGSMRHEDFWNLLGRAGRIEQPPLGVVGIAVGEASGERMDRTEEYVRKTTEALASRLVDMVDGVLANHSKIDLASLSGEPGWSSFVQYIAHLKNQSSAGLGAFVSESEVMLMETFGYGRLDRAGQRALLDAIKVYAGELYEKPRASMLSDLTGFSPESVVRAEKAIKDIGMDPAEWSKEGLFGQARPRLAGLVSAMLGGIPEVKDLSNVLPGRKRRDASIAGVVADWVGGRGIADISRAHFGGDDTDSMTACVRAIYGRIVHSASWGLAGLQRIHGLEGDGGEADPGARSARNLPAMVYHGVDTDEAVLMRMNGVPRGAARRVGRAYAEHLGGQDVYSASSSDKVLEWLGGLSEGTWRPESGTLTGRECKGVWRELAGIEA